MNRITLDGVPAVYHCMSRIVGGQRLLDDLGKEKLVGILRRLSQFCGLEVITYCVMPNHFHVLVRVPVPPTYSDQDLLERLSKYYGNNGILTALARESFSNRGKIDDDIRESVLCRMGNISSFMKELKQNFSKWFNRHNARFGTLWAERFTSVLIEDSPGTVRLLAAYIDLNPVRAGLVEDPKDYRFCGYSAGLGGENWIRRGILSFSKSTDWSKAAAEYRMLLFVTAGSSGRSDKKVLDRAVIKKELERGGELSVGQILRLRIRHMTDGVFLGSQDFVNEMFLAYREHFGPNRKNGARPIRGVSLPQLSALRDLRVNALG